MPNFNPRDHYDACVRCVQLMNAIRQDPPGLCSNAPQWALFSAGTTAVGQSCLTAYQNIVQLGAAPRYNPAYLTMLQNAPLFCAAELADLANEVNNSNDARSGFRALRDLMNTLRDPFNLGIFPALGPVNVAETSEEATEDRLSRRVPEFAGNDEITRLIATGGAGAVTPATPKGSPLLNFPGAPSPIDSEVVGPVGVAASGQAVYLVYQTEDGSIYVTLNDGAANLFPAKRSLVVGPDAPNPTLAMPGTGPAIAYDPVNLVLSVAYQTDDGSAIVIASNSPALNQPWTVSATVPLPMAILAGLGLLQLVSNGQDVLLLYALFNGQPYGKVVYATSANGWNGWNSVMQAGQPLNPTGAVVGPSVASLAGYAGAFLSWAGFEADAYLASSSDGVNFGASLCFTPVGGASITPAAVAPGNPESAAFINGFGTALVSSDEGGDAWSSCAAVAPYEGVAIGDLAAAPTSAGGILVAIDTTGNMSWVSYS